MTHGPLHTLHYNQVVCATCQWQYQETVIVHELNFVSAILDDLYTLVNIKIQLQIKKVLCFELKCARCKILYRIQLNKMEHITSIHIFSNTKLSAFIISWKTFTAHIEASRSSVTSCSHCYRCPEWPN